MASASEKPIIGISMGDPAGIGAEVILKALMDPEIRQMARFVVYGIDELLTYVADNCEFDIFWRKISLQDIRNQTGHIYGVVVADYDDINWDVSRNPIKPSVTGGKASMRFVKDATEDAINGNIDALVTAPICKASWYLAGFKKYPGHTELLTSLCRAKRSAMMFTGAPFRVTLATIHEGLFSLRHSFKIGTVFDAIDLTNETLKKYFDIETPHIAVCGLNPHAGEGGLFGDEEERVIAPAVLLAQEAGIKVTAPMPADTLFYHALTSGKYDCVIAMYHDQGLIPVKMLAFDKAVNITIGLPIIRTSPDHGTAFDIVNTNSANPSSMIEAIKTACKMASYRINRPLITR